MRPSGTSDRTVRAAPPRRPVGRAGTSGATARPKCSATQRRIRPANRSPAPPPPHPCAPLLLHPLHIARAATPPLRCRRTALLRGAPPTSSFSVHDRRALLRAPLILRFPRTHRLVLSKPPCLLSNSPARPSSTALPSKIAPAPCSAIRRHVRSLRFDSRASPTPPPSANGSATVRHARRRSSTVHPRRRRPPATPPSRLPSTRPPSSAQDRLELSYASSRPNFSSHLHPLDSSRAFVLRPHPHASASIAFFFLSFLHSRSPLLLRFRRPDRMLPRRTRVGSDFVRAGRPSRRRGHASLPSFSPPTRPRLGSVTGRGSGGGSARRRRGAASREERAFLPAFPPRPSPREG